MLFDMLKILFELFFDLLSTLQKPDDNSEAISLELPKSQRISHMLLNVINPQLFIPKCNLIELFKDIFFTVVKGNKLSCYASFIF